MVAVVLFHSALGLRPAVHRAGARLRDAGHEVLLPDLYDGRTFHDVDEGVAHAEQLGWPVLQSRAQAALVDAPEELVVAGMSMGAGLALEVAAERPGVRGALLLHAGGPPDDPWPATVPVEVHHAVADPWVDAGEPAALLEQVARAGATATLHVYPGDAHLFTDEDLDEHDPALAGLLWERALAFLTRASYGTIGR